MLESVILGDPPVRTQMPAEVADGYKSPSQRARVISEAWAGENLFCPSCPSPTIEPLPPNTQAIDFRCPACAAAFQLKCQSRPFTSRITDAAYQAMVNAVRHEQTPNVWALHYDRIRWTVRELILIPHFALSLSCIERRKPLSSTARRKGWVGCNIVIGNLPPEARIRVVIDGIPTRSHLVREQYGFLRPLAKVRHGARGWTLDVLRLIRSLPQEEFSLGDVYALRTELQRLHPENLHIEEKVRQQLQRLRDLGLIAFLGHGRYRLRGAQRPEHTK